MLIISSDREEEIKHLKGASNPPEYLARGLWDWCAESLGIGPTSDEVSNFSFDG